MFRRLINALTRLQLVIRKGLSPGFWHRQVNRVVPVRERSLPVEVRLEKYSQWLRYTTSHSSHRFLRRYPLRILYVAPKYDYADPRRGLSDHEASTLHCLAHCGHEIIRFDFESTRQKVGTEAMNQMLLEAAYRYAPDLVLLWIHRPGLSLEVLHEISSLHGTTTYGLFSDDIRRFESFSSMYAPALNWIGTDWEPCVARYKAMGCQHVLFKPYTCNHFFFRKLGLPLTYDVSFVGQSYGTRGETIKRLREAGLPVRVWGYGSMKGRLTQTQMMEVYNRSRINLDVFGRADMSQADEMRSRPFEASGCGQLVITRETPRMAEFYQPGKEMVFYRDTGDLIEKIRYYLDHEEERAAIALAGYERTLKAHTMEKQFEREFTAILGERLELDSASS